MKNDFESSPTNAQTAKSRKRLLEARMKQLKLEEERANNEISLEKKREKMFAKQAKTLIDRYKNEDRLVQVWAGRPHEEILRELLDLFDEEPVRVVIETKNKAKSRKVGQHNSHQNDMVNKQGLVSSPLQINTAQHTFIRGGHSKSKKLPQQKDKVVSDATKPTIQTDLQNWLRRIDVLPKKIVNDLNCWRRKFANVSNCLIHSLDL